MIMIILFTALELQVFWDSFIAISLMASFFIMFGLFLVLVYSNKYRNACIIGILICCAYIYFILVWNFIWPLVYGFPK
ncbi:MAG: hypothetical protein ACTSVY_13015 [Candidatus Helarchaeota archaeon]